jgi:two-component system, NtrC family, sensor histidine kinase KinB
VSVRIKHLLALLPLAIALAFVAVVAIRTASLLGQYSNAILKDNYRSILAAERMKEALERMNDAPALALIGGTAGRAVADVAVQRQRFEAELRVQEHNITEPGEDEATRRLRALWTTYQEQFDRFREIAAPTAAQAFFSEELTPAFVAVKKAADTILDINHDAMVQKSERAQQAAQRTYAALILASVTALVIGGLLSAAVTTRLVQPLAVLTRTVERIGAGDFDARISLRGHDETTQLAAHVNALAVRLSQYRRSSLGELLLAQQAAQATLDSLPDPVIIFDVHGGVLNVNRAAETLLGLKLDSTVSNPLAAVEPSVRSVVERARDHVLSGKGPYIPKGFEEATRIASPAGDAYLLPRATPVLAEEGGVGAATVILQDVTRLRRVDELKNDMVATVAHELRTPLTSLRMAIHVCLEQTAGPLTDQQADVLYAARHECERLQSTVDELLDLARIQGGQLDLRTRQA